MRKLLPLCFILLFLSHEYPVCALTRQSNAQKQLERALKASKSDLRQAALEQRNSLEKLLVFQQDDVRAAAEAYRNKRQLYDQGKIEQSELDASRRILESAEATVKKTKKEIWAIESEFQLLPLQHGPKERPAGTPISDQGQAQALIALDREDDILIQDAMNELARIGFTMSITNQRIQALLEQAKTIMLKYCKCTMAQYEDYLKGKGLPSVVNQIENSNTQMSSGDAIASNYLNNRMKTLQGYFDSQKALYDSTVELTITRLSESFIRHGGRSIEGYNLDIRTKRFIPLKPTEPKVPLGEAVRNYATSYVQNMDKKNTERIVADVIRQEQLREGITPKPQRPQRGKPARKPLAKSKTPV